VEPTDVNFRVRPDLLRRSLSDISPLAEAFAGSDGSETNETRVFDGRLPVLDRFPIRAITDHLDESGRRGIFRNETMVPAFFGRPPRRTNTGRLSRP
jgi:hypothetical protein